MTLREKYGEMYGEGEHFSNNVNKNIFNQQNDYTNNDFNNSPNNYMNNSPNNYNNSYMNNNSPTKNSYMNNIPSDNSSSSLLYYGFIMIIVLIIGAIVYFKDIIINEIKKIYKPTNKINDEIKQLNKSIKKEKQIREKKEKEKETEQKKQKGGIKQLENKINYKTNQIAKDDGYCYIGYDKGMRNCGEIYESQVCMSGEIFPSLEMCMFPRLRE